MGRHHAFLCAIGAALLVGNAAPIDVFTGGWWLAQSDDVQAAFLEGEEDCYFTFVRPAMAAVDNQYDEQIMLTSYIKANPATRTQSLLSIFHATERLRPPTDDDKQAEGWGDPHGVLDGRFWEGLNHQERLTYVHGYLACRAMYLHRPPRRPAAQIEHAISAWYGLDGDEVKEGHKVGALIDRFG